MLKSRLFLPVLNASIIANVSAQSYSFEDAITTTPVPSPSLVISDMDSDSHDSDDYEDHELVDLNLSANISTLGSSYTNWVGPGFGAGVDAACYRESHVADVCPVGFEYKLGTCWAQCPLEYLVECGMQCIRQNDDCTLEMLSKVSAVAQSALSIATFGACGAFSKMAKGVQIAFQCGKEVANLVKALTKYVRTVQVTDPQTTTDQLLTKLYQTDNVVYELPITIMSCLGIKISKGMKVSDRVTHTIDLFVKEVITNKDAIASSWGSFTTFMKNITLGGTIDELNATDITSLQSALESNSTCGEDMKRLTDRVWLTIANLRNENPAIYEAGVRVKMYESNLRDPNGDQQLHRAAHCRIGRDDCIYNARYAA